MRYIVCAIICSLFFACAKEDALENEIDFTNIYAIADNPSDSVQHERYLLYEQYGVSVYFNDTIDQVFVRNDVYGNPVYRYELIDPSWLFFQPESGTTTSSKFDYVYAEGEEKQLKYLDGVRTFLESVSTVLHPSMIFVADSIFTLNSQGERGAEVTFTTNFRVMLWTRVDEIVDGGTLEDAISEIETTLIEDKIENFTTQVDEFGAVSDPSYYGRQDLYDLPTTEPWWNWYSASMFEYGYPSSMEDDYPEFLQDRFDYLYGQEDYWIVPEEYWIQSRQAWAALSGPYGFVGCGVIASETPRTVSADLKQFLDQMLRFSREEFEFYWGNYTLVMKKYNILRDLIENEIGVKL